MTSNEIECHWRDILKRHLQIVYSVDRLSYLIVWYSLGSRYDLFHFLFPNISSVPCGKRVVVKLAEYRLRMLSKNRLSTDWPRADRITYVQLILINAWTFEDSIRKCQCAISVKCQFTAQTIYHVYSGFTSRQLLREFIRWCTKGSRLRLVQNGVVYKPLPIKKPYIKKFTPKICKIWRRRTRT